MGEEGGFRECHGGFWERDEGERDRVLLRRVLFRNGVCNGPLGFHRCRLFLFGFRAKMGWVRHYQF